MSNFRVGQKTQYSQKKYQDNFFISDDYRNRTDFTLEEIVEAYSISENRTFRNEKYC